MAFIFILAAFIGGMGVGLLVANKNPSVAEKAAEEAKKL